MAVIYLKKLSTCSKMKHFKHLVYLSLYTEREMPVSTKIPLADYVSLCFVKKTCPITMSTFMSYEWGKRQMA